MKIFKNKDPSMEPLGTPGVIFLYTLKQFQTLHLFSVC